MMNVRCSYVWMGLLFAGGMVCAQQTGTRPVLSAAPAAAGSEANAAGAPAATSMSMPTGTGTISASYVIEPEDSLAVTVWKEPTLSGTFPVRPDGQISLALLGDLRAAGFTPTQLGLEITERLQKYVNDPRVTVTIMGVHVDKVFLLGEVMHVGPVPITPGMTPLQAISAGGGLTPYANGKRVYVLRKTNGQEKKIPFNYKKALKDGDEQGVALLAGDTIVVP
jgi:polysaccharide export outer membrane protein